MEEDLQEREDGDRRGNESTAFPAFSSLLPGTPPSTLCLGCRDYAITIVLSFSHPFPSNSRLEDPRCGLYFVLVPKPALRTGPGQVFCWRVENRSFFPSNEQP